MGTLDLKIGYTDHEPKGKEKGVVRVSTSFTSSRCPHGIEPKGSLIEVLVQDLIKTYNIKDFGIEKLKQNRQLYLVDGHDNTISVLPGREHIKY